MSKQIEAMKLALEALEETERVYTEPAGYEGKYGKALDQAISKQQEKIDAARSDVLNAITALREALAEQPAQQVEWVDAGDLKQLKKGDVIRVIRNGEVYYSPFGYCGVLEECDYAYYREPSQFVYLEVGTATVEKIVYTRKDFATGAVYANRGDRVEVAHGITKGNT